MSAQLNVCESVCGSGVCQPLAAAGIVQHSGAMHSMFPYWIMRGGMYGCASACVRMVYQYGTPSVWRVGGYNRIFKPRWQRRGTRFGIAVVWHCTTVLTSSRLSALLQLHCQVTVPPGSLFCDCCICSHGTWLLVEHVAALLLHL